MREFWKKTALRAVVGFALGLLIGLGILVFTGNLERYADRGPMRLAVYLLVSGLVGAINVGTTTVYTLERWGILRCTLTHFAIAMTCLCVVGFHMGWFSLHDPVSWLVLAGTVVAYCVIWLINYLLYLRRIRRINTALRRWKDAQADE